MCAVRCAEMAELRAKRAWGAAWRCHTRHVCTSPGHRRFVDCVRCVFHSLQDHNRAHRFRCQNVSVRNCRAMLHSNTPRKLGTSSSQYYIFCLFILDSRHFLLVPFALCSVLRCTVVFALSSFVRSIPLRCSWQRCSTSDQIAGENRAK